MRGKDALEAEQNNIVVKGNQTSVCPMSLSVVCELTSESIMVALVSGHRQLSCISVFIIYIYNTVLLNNPSFNATLRTRATDSP